MFVVFRPLNMTGRLIIETSKGTNFALRVRDVLCDLAERINKERNLQWQTGCSSRSPTLSHGYRILHVGLSLGDYRSSRDSVECR